MSVSSINERITLHTHNGSFFQIDLNAYPLACCPIASLPRYVFFILRSIPPSVHSSTALPPYPLPDHPASDAGALHLCSLHDETTTPANITTAVGVVLCFFQRRLCEGIFFFYYLVGTKHIFKFKLLLSFFIITFVQIVFKILHRAPKFYETALEAKFVEEAAGTPSHGSQRRRR